jgi:hypothetical protein
MPEAERPTYGITKPVTSYNPVYLVFHEWVDIFKDLAKAKNFKEGWQILFGKPGDDVIAKRERATQQKELQTTLSEAKAEEVTV